MKNKKPLQFVKELPPHAELWKIIDETIIYPAEGLSVEQIKHHMYVYLCSSGDFKYDKLILQTNMEIEHLQIIKSRVTKSRDLPYRILLPVSEELPHGLLVFIYEHYIGSSTLPDTLFVKINKLEEILGSPLPDLSTLPHSDEVVEVSSKRNLEIVIYKALIENMPIPTFKLVVAPTTTTADSDGWIEWNGGDCPIDPNIMVEIKHRIEESTATNRAKVYRWDHKDNNGDIIAYRIIKEDRNET